MNQNIMYKPVLFVLAFLLASCNEKETGNDNVIRLAEAIDVPSEIKVSDCFSRIRYIPLETTDSSLVGKGAYVQIIKNRILISTNQRQCLMFDKETGKFIKQVGHIGNDPEGYSSVNCWGDNETGMIYFNRWNKELVCYDQDGLFREVIATPLNAEGNSSIFFSCREDGTFVSHEQGMLGNGASRLSFFKDNEQITSYITINNDEQPFDPSNIASLSVLKDDRALELYGPTAREGVIVVDYKEPETGFVTLTNTQTLWHQGKNHYFKEAYNDTIYQVKGTTLVPAVILDLGKYHWDFSERFMKNKDNAVLITQILDSKDRMVINFIRQLFHKPVLYNTVVSKSTGEVKVGLYADAFKDDLTGFLPVQPVSVSSEGEYVGLLSAADVYTWFEENKEIKDIPQNIKELKQIGEEDNPVVVICTNY